MTGLPKADVKEFRRFPRIGVRCPVLYRVHSAKRWQVAKLVDFSATGLRMECDENLPAGIAIALQIKPGSNKTVPALSAQGEVVRSQPNDALVFEVSCKLTKVRPG